MIKYRNSNILYFRPWVGFLSILSAGKVSKFSLKSLPYLSIGISNSLFELFEKQSIASELLYYRNFVTYSSFLYFLKPVLVFAIPATWRKRWKPRREEFTLQVKNNLVLSFKLKLRKELWGETGKYRFGEKPWIWFFWYFGPSKENSTDQNEAWCWGACEIRRCWSVRIGFQVLICLKSSSVNSENKK